MKKLLYFSCMIGLLFSCTKNDEKAASQIPNLPAQNFEYRVSSSELPDHFFTPNFDDGFNEKATLGRVLFYDKKISINQSVSCGSCHNQSLGFADDEAFSKGFSMQDTRRNSSHLANLFGYSSFFWDARSHSLEDVIFQPIQDHIEMGFDNKELLVERIENQYYYSDLFDAAYGTSSVSQENIEDAISCFLRSMISYQSEYDKAVNSDFATLSMQEQLGAQLFFGKAKCGSCHNGMNLGASGEIANTGLYLDYPDKGVAALGSGQGIIAPGPGQVINSSGVGEFKVPGLRNVGLTAPYMHDGSLASLRDVINHYNVGLQPHENLDWKLALDVDANGNFIDEDGNLLFDVWWDEPENGGNPAPLNLDVNEVDALEAFLHTLTDYQYVNDVKFSDPF